MAAPVCYDRDEDMKVTRILWRALILAAIVGAAGCPFSTDTADKPKGVVSIAELLPQVTQSEIYATASDLQDFVTRKFGYASNVQAGTYLHDRLAALPNLEVEYQGGDYRNVVATLPGTGSDGDGVLIVGAHYDSTASDPAVAPGAMDDGCGVAIVLELARIMSQYGFPRTVRFACWNNEEGSPTNSIAGSRDYAKSAYLASENILLCFNLDSVAYDPQGSLYLDVLYDDVSTWAKDLVVQLDDDHDIGFDLHFNEHTGCFSDHKSFWLYGYAAVALHSESHGPTHNATDTVEKISLDYARRIGQLALAVLGTLASE